MLKAVCFDFDGVIVDTEPLHFQAFNNVLEPRGLGFDWPTYISGFIGFDDRDAFREAFRQAGQPLDEPTLSTMIRAKAQAFQDIIATTDVKSYPGVAELINALSGAVPVGLCSGALRSDIDPILSRMNLLAAFDVIITADQVQQSKPAPESYVKTMHHLQQLFPAMENQAGWSLAIEDTPTGIQSARGAGLSVLAVANSYPPAQLTDADWTIQTLAGLTLQKLQDKAFREI